MNIIETIHFRASSARGQFLQHPPWLRMAAGQIFVVLLGVGALAPMGIRVQAQPIPAPPGLVAWWPGDGDANDIIGNNNGTLQNSLGFAAGEVGQAFNFTQANQDVLVAASSSLDVGLGNGYSIEAWINPADVGMAYPLVEWNNAGSEGAHFWISVSCCGSPGPGCLYANIVDTVGGSHYFFSAGALVQTGSWQHVALAYDQTTGIGSLFLNGSQVASQNLGSFTPLTSYPLHLGLRPGDHTYSGLMDEVSIYNRALSADEILAIYQAGSAGKIKPFMPALYLVSASQITDTTATLSGNVIANGFATAAYFDYGQATNYGTATAVTDVGSGTTPVIVSNGLSGLATQTVYHFRLVAYSSQGTNYSADQTFRTGPFVVPNATTLPASAVSSVTATVNGTVNPNGYATTAHFEYGLTTAYGTSTPALNVGNGTSSVSVSNRVSGLSVNTSYHFRLVAINAGGTNSGADVSFTTALPPTGLTVNVPATSAIWLAAQPAGAQAYGDVAPRNSPVLIDLGPWPAEGALTFEVSGTTSRDPDIISYPLVGADGEATVSGGYSLGPIFNLSGLTCGFSSLVGVFLSDSTLAIPTNLTFVSEQEKGFAELWPKLQQVFFIGDGLTGQGVGQRQMFHVPASATRLYLGLFDVGNYNNVGALDVTVRGAEACTPGTALSFNGAGDYVQIPGFCSNAPTTEVTVEFWQNVSAVRQQSTFCQDDDQRGGFDGSNVFNGSVPYSDNGGTVYWDFGDIANGGRLAYQPQVSLVGTWQHFALEASQSGNFMRIYRNGILEAEKAGMTPYRGGNFDLRIGGEISSQFYIPYGGLIDEFRIWNVARTQSQIQANMNRSLTSPQSGLVAYWRFDEGAGALASDSSGHGQNGNLFGPLWVTSTVSFAPNLSISSSNSAIVLSWPSPQACFRLQQSSFLDTAWVNVTNPPAVIGDWNQVILPAITGQKLYRLISQ